MEWTVVSMIMGHNEKGHELSETIIDAFKLNGVRIATFDEVPDNATKPELDVILRRIKSRARSECQKV